MLCVQPGIMWTASILSPDTSNETNGSEESNNNASENEEVSSEIDLENAIILTKDNY